MSITEGLAALKKAGTRKQGGQFLRVQDGETLKVRFLQELDRDAAGYNPEAGLGFLALEWRDPDDYKKRVLCTLDDEGRSWPEEQSRVDKRWKQRASLYINVLVEDEKGERSVRVLNQGFGPKSVTKPLIEFAEEYGTITDRWFKLKRKGSGQNDTEYALIPMKEDAEPFDTTGIELVDLKKVVNHIPYAEQEAFFRGETPDAPEEKW